jgi:hypothetical protein
VREIDDQTIVEIEVSILSVGSRVLFWMTTVLIFAALVIPIVTGRMSVLLIPAFLLLIAVELVFMMWKGRRIVGTSTNDLEEDLTSMVKYHTREIA